MPTDWTYLGFADVAADADRRVRRNRLRAADRRGEVYPSFPLALFARAQGLTAEWFDDGQFRLDGRPVPLDADGSLLINYVGPRSPIPPSLFTRFSTPLGAAGRWHEIGPHTTVLIGVTTLVSEDLHPVPRLHGSIGRALRAAWLYHDADEMPGVEVHANLIATLCRSGVHHHSLVAERAADALGVWCGNGSALGPLQPRGWRRGALVHHFGWQIVCLLLFRWFDWRVEMVAMLILGPTLYAAIFALRWRGCGG